MCAIVRDYVWVQQEKKNANRLEMGSIQIWLQIVFLSKKLQKFNEKQRDMADWAQQLSKDFWRRSKCTTNYDESI